MKRTSTFAAALALAALLAAACSDDGAAANGQDQGVAKPDGKGAKLDGKAAKPDGKKPKPDSGPPNPGFKGWKDLPAKWTGAGAHSATLLKDGRVLLAGGLIYETGAKGSAKAWIYNPTQGKFNAVADMNQPRGFHHSLLLKDGRVMVIGGRDGSSYKPLASAEIFNPSTKKWSKTPDMPTKRSGLAAVRLPNGNVLVSGGYSNATTLDTMVIFEPKSNSWLTPATSLKKRRSAHTMTLMNNGKVLIAGGYGGSGTDRTKYTQLDSFEVYDANNGTLSLSKAKMGDKRAGHTAALLDSGKVMLVGGYCGFQCTPSGDELYDPTKDQASKINHQGKPPSHHAMVKLNDGKIVVIGGSFADEKKVVIFDPKGNYWKTGPSLKHGRFDHTVTLLKSGRMLVAGGKTGSPSDWKAPVVPVAELSTP